MIPLIILLSKVVTKQGWEFRGGFVIVFQLNLPRGFGLRAGLGTGHGKHRMANWRDIYGLKGPELIVFPDSECFWRHSHLVVSGRVLTGTINPVQGVDRITVQ